jgi:hypothetical protein
MKQKANSISVVSPAKQIAGFISKFDPAVAKLIISVRSALRNRFPTANELVYDNYNFFVIGYCSTERASDCIVSLAAQAKEFRFRSTTEQRCLTRTNFWRAAEIRIDLSAWKARRP